MRRDPATPGAWLLLALFALAPLAPARADETPPGKAPGKTPAEAPAPAVAFLAAPGTRKALRWRPLGPAAMGGRVTALAVDASDASRWWVATASGGLLKTEDNGITFAHQFDREAVVSIGDVAVAPSDSRIVWVGTGECNPRNSVSWGNGVYKSVDGGATWKHMGLTGAFQVGAVRIHPRNPDVVYVGALGRLWGPNAERGLFKTTDGGATWSQILFVDENTGVIDVALDPADPETLLVATWERRRDGYDTNAPARRWGPGSGLYKSSDGGATFRRLATGLPTGDLGRVGIAWAQADPGVVYVVVASERIGQEPENAPYMGINGENADVGARLTQIAKGGPAEKAGLVKGDIVVRVDGATVHGYADLLRLVRQHVAGDTIEVEVSRERKGVTVSLPLAERPKPKAPAGQQAGPGPGGAERPISPFGAFLGGQLPNLHDQQGKEGHEYGGVYRSNDAGETWSRVNSANPRPMYFSEIRVDPQDTQKVWLLGIRLWRSTDGGAHFEPDGAPGSVHVDHHALWIDPRDPRHMILGNDGGIYVTYDGGKHYDHLNHVAIGQFYDVGVDAQRDYRVYGGLQDNGSWGGPNRVRHAAGPTNSDWLRIGGGDGFRCRVDANDPGLVYFEAQYGGIGRRHLETGERAMMQPRPPKGTTYRFNWSTPFVLSAHNSRIYYVAGNRVFRSLDRGNGLRTISGEIVLTPQGSATALAESPRDPDRLYVGSDDGALFTTADGGHTWVDLRAPPAAQPEPAVEAGSPGPGTAAERGDAEGDDEGADGDDAGTGNPHGDGDEAPGAGPTDAPSPPGQALAVLLPEPRWVSWIEPSRFDARRVYLVLDGHRSDDDRPHVYVSEDGGSTWRALHGDLPAGCGTTRVLSEDRENPDVLYLGTEFGAWVSVDRGDHWASLNTNLPTVAVHAFAQPAAAEDLVAATHGRSLWALDVSALRRVTGATLTAKAHLYTPQAAVHWRPEPARGAARTFVGENPQAGAAIHYGLAGKTASVTLRVLDGEGRLLRELETSPEPGLHRVVWDLRGPPPKGQRRFPARVKPGTYTVELAVGDEVQRQPLEVRLDPEHPDPGWLAHEDEAEELEARRAQAKRARQMPRGDDRDE